MSDQEQSQEQPVAESSNLSPQELEKQEEAKLKAKYNIGPNQPHGLKASGHSAFLQKRLSKGQKYFDSGDYQMAKQKFGNAPKTGLQLPGPIPLLGTGEAIPTPESVPVRKTSLVQPKFSNIS